MYMNQVRIHLRQECHHMCWDKSCKQMALLKSNALVVRYLIGADGSQLCQNEEHHLRTALEDQSAVKQVKFVVLH
jgi:hypothetical protein